jgi:predicted metal-dependent hydrolase
MIVESMNVNGIDFTVKVHYEKRKNTTATIRKQVINIRVPIFLSSKEKNKQLLKMKEWAEQKISFNPEKFKSKSCREYQNEDILKIVDEQYVINIDYKDKASSSAKLNEHTISLCISSHLSKAEENKHVSALLSRCIADKKLPELREKINTLNKKHFNQKINRIRFKNHKSKWGSCSHAGNINIATRLLFAPDDVLEYVCIHELAHLVESNHSKRFWALVENAMPNYKDKQKWLKENGESHCSF